MQSRGTSSVVQSVRSSQPSTCTGPLSWSNSHCKYSCARARSSFVPDMKTVYPTYSTMHPDERASFFRVIPFLPRAYDSSSGFSTSVFVPNSASSSSSSMRSVKYPGTFVSTAAITLSCAPRRPRFGPKMASFSVSPSRPRPLPRKSAKNMSVPHSSSTERRKLPCAPVTKPTASEGTEMVVRSSASWSASSIVTGPTRCAITHSMYFFARRRASSGPRISSWSECS
mmetsp:Transcript_17529/g.40172  ORF Transcript_17529/g.40172 Transcript_17529/m.40172 type:complete len:227 (+) Transcript_17529:156-836(+)